MGQPWSIPRKSEQPKIKLGDIPSSFKFMSAQLSNNDRALIRPPLPTPVPRDTTVYSGSPGGQHG